MLAALWQQRNVFEIGDVLTTSIGSAQQAVGQIGAGTAVAEFSALSPAHIFILAVPDQCIESAARSLDKAGVVNDSTIVCHLSGATPSSILIKAGLAPKQVASVHPIRSFGDFEQSVHGFPGTWCGFEGSSAVERDIKQAFEAIGANIFDIDADRKLAYHAACLMMSNYLNGLVDAGLDCFEQAGIDRQTALTLSTPILQNTLANIVAKGPSLSLTGPIARGEWQIVAAELAELERLDARQAEIYRSLGKMTLKTAKEKLTKAQYSKLAAVLG